MDRNSPVRLGRLTRTAAAGAPHLRLRRCSRCSRRRGAGAACDRRLDVRMPDDQHVDLAVRQHLLRLAAQQYRAPAAAAVRCHHDQVALVPAGNLQHAFVGMVRDGEVGPARDILLRCRCRCALQDLLRGLAHARFVFLRGQVGARHEVAGIQRRGIGRADVGDGQARVERRGQAGPGLDRLFSQGRSRRWRSGCVSTSHAPLSSQATRLAKPDPAGYW